MASFNRNSWTGLLGKRYPWCRTWMSRKWEQALMEWNEVRRSKTECSSSKPSSNKMLRKQSKQFSFCRVESMLSIARRSSMKRNHSKSVTPRSNRDLFLVGSRRLLNSLSREALFPTEQPKVLWSSPAFKSKLVFQLKLWTIPSHRCLIQCRNLRNECI